MKNKKYIIIAAAAVIAVVGLYFFLRATGDKLFDFSAVDESCAVYVIRNDHNVPKFVDDRHLTEHKKYLLDSEDAQQFFDLMNSTVYRKKLETNYMKSRKND